MLLRSMYESLLERGGCTWGCEAWHEVRPWDMDCPVKAKVKA